MRQAPDDTDSRAATDQEAGQSVAVPDAEPLVLVDHEAGRVLVRDRRETVGYELRARRGRRGSGFGWVELQFAGGAVMRTAVSAAEVMAVARDAGREHEVAELSRRAAAELAAKGDPAADRFAARLRDEVSAGLDYDRVSLRALQARLRERLAQGETFVTMCERGGFVDRDGRIDSTWLQRRAGLLPERCSRTGKVRRARTANYEVFLRLVRAVDGTPEEFGV